MDTVTLADAKARLSELVERALQGETVRILYIHVPAAWLGMAGWSGIAASSIAVLVWRHPLAAIAARASVSRYSRLPPVLLPPGPPPGLWIEWVAS